MKRVWILALDGVFDSSLSITLDVLRAAATLARQSKFPGLLQVQVVGAKRRVATGAGLTLKAELSMAQAMKQPAPDWLILPASGAHGDALDERMRLPDVAAAQRLLRAVSANGAAIATSCASVFLLAGAALLDGKRATTAWWMADQLRARHPRVRLEESRMVVRDQGLLTAGSAFAHLDLMLAVAADLFGPGVAHRCARLLVIDERHSQARYMVRTHARAHDPLVERAERWIDEHLADAILIGAMARELAVTHKTLSRHIQAATGLSPNGFVRRRRALAAVHLIETTKRPLGQIANEVGYQDSANLRRLLRREVGATPSALRAGPG